MLSAIERRLPERVRHNLLLKLFALARVPLIWWVRARVVELTDRRCVVSIPLRRRTRNHLRSMYIGVLCVGADVAGGLMAVSQVRRLGKPIAPVFGDLNARFLKRAEADTHFTCEDGGTIAEMIAETARTGERISRPVRVTATTPSVTGDELVAIFELTLSLKQRSRA